MAMIKCKECGKDISDKAKACVNCGAPITSSAGLWLDVDGDGKFGASDVTMALRLAKDKASSSVGSLVNQGKELIKPQSLKDEEAVERLMAGLDSEALSNFSNTDIDCRKFIAALESTVHVKYAEIMKGKPEGARFLTYADGMILTGTVRNVFKNAIGVTPPQVEAACCFSEAILAPSSEEKEKLLKMAAGLGGGTAGVSMVFGGVGSALGWIGGGAIASAKALVFGTAVAGPLGMAAAGITLAGMAAYFATTNNKANDSERFMKVLRNSSEKAVEVSWDEHKEALNKVLNVEQKG